VADFKTALEALGQGKVGLDALSKQLDKLLQTTPQHATRLLAQLDEAFGAKKIDNAAYTKLKGQINQYRRTHAKETESAEEGGRDSTVFAQEDNFEKQGAAAAAPTGGGARAAAHDSTRVMGDEEKPATGAGVDVDVSQPSLDSSAPSDIPPSTGPTGTKWQTPLSSEAAIAQEMGPGSVIKERFKLMDVLGVGGMGKVYKGVDLLKQEARDKNPYIAIKLLNEDFKSHPEAFIALQRESSRQQKLAHPNIATVYDFDRIGGPGTPVFITMELMEGQPLNNYIKKTVRKQNGLPFPEAFNIVKQLGAALQYAHERRLVHSDFKPGNAFLCNDGTVKTLDFGIARAVKNPLAGEGEKTLFDPGKLGALTPAYASLEMLEGEEPDPRDDIYALGCVAYELLTGKHPYNKLPANTARDNGLIPAPVKGLNKKQNRALRHALAYKREDRSPKVQDFIEEFEGKANLHKNPFFIAAMVLLIVGAIAVQPVRQYFHQKEIEGIIAEINSGNAQTIAAKLDEIRGLEKADQTTITDESKVALQKYLTAEVTKHIDITGQNYDFPAADVALNAVREFYPDSLFLQERQNEVEFNRKQKLADLYNNYIAALQDTTLLGTTSDILQTIGKRIDPNHPLLTDPRPANAYRLAAEQAMSTGDLEQALTLVGSGLKSAPNDARLADLQKTVQTAKRVGELRGTLGGLQFASLTDYKQQEAAIVELAGLVGSGQERPVLGPLATNLKKIVGDELARVLKSGGRSDAQTLADEYGPLLSSLQLQQELTQIKLAHLTGDERTQAIQQIVAADKATVDERLANPNLEDAQWESQLLASVRELDSLKTEDAAIAGDLQAYRDRIAALYEEQANNLVQANRFDAAQAFVDRGERFAPGLASLTELRNAIAQSKAALEKQQRIDDLKDRFKVQTEADRVVEAQQIFDELKTILPADDPYVTTGAPTVLASSYQRLAERAVASGDMETAVKLAQAGLKLAPNNAELQRIANESGVESNITQLTQLFSDATLFTEDEIKRIQLQVDQIEKGAPTRYSDFRRQAETTLAGRVNTLAQSDQNAAGALATAAYRIFPTSSTLEDLSRRYVVKAWPRKAEADAALQTGALSQANRLLQEAAGGEFATHPDVQTLQRTLESRTKEANEKIGGVTSAFESAKQVADRNDRRTALSDVRSKLSPILEIWSDNPDFNSIKAEVDQAIAATMIRGREAEIDVAAAASSAAAAKPWSPVSSDYPCTAGLAGHGARARAICFDLVNTGWRGPPMVVVPAGGNLGKNFAIGKYEISVGDWSKYCALSGKCKPVMDKERHDDPMTGVTLGQAQEYVKWLSERTGKTYRLPTTEEWEYAATVGGAMTPESQEFRAIKGQLNCRVTMGDKVLKGTGTADVKSGGQNKWGLKNFVGNVQELVVDGSGTASVRGGAYSDPIANCEVSTGRPYGGGADDTTGFRVVLDEVG
jgi:serine/threonine protein kinase